MRWSISSALRSTFLAARPSRQIGRGEVIAQRLDAEPGEIRVRVELARRDERHVAEAARVVVGDDRPARHREHEVVVLGVAAVLVGVLAELDSAAAGTHRAANAEHALPPPCGGGARGGGIAARSRWLPPPLTPPHKGEGNSGGVGRLRQLHAEPAGHAEVHGQHLAVVEMDEDVLGAPVEPLDRAPREPLGEALGQRKAQVRAALLHAHEAAPAQHRLEALRVPSRPREAPASPAQAPGSAFNPAAAMPATAAISSLSEVSPETPTAPTTRARAVADQHAAGHRDQRAADGVGDGGDEVRALGGHLAERARAEPHGERAVRLAGRDLGALEAGAVLGGERLERAARIEHGDRQRLEVCVLALASAAATIFCAISSFMGTSSRAYLLQP